MAPVATAIASANARLKSFPSSKQVSAGDLLKPGGPLRRAVRPAIALTDKPGLGFSALRRRSRVCLQLMPCLDGHRGKPLGEDLGIRLGIDQIAKAVRRLRQRAEP